MKQISDNDELLTRYLLGELNEDEQTAVEQRYIGEPSFYEQLLAVEDDLIDSYAEGGLSPSQRISFESHFLMSPERQTRVGFAKAWMRYVSTHEIATKKIAPQQGKRFRLLSTSGWQAGLRVAAVVLIVLGLGLLTADIVRLKGRIQQAEGERAELEQRKRELESQIDEAQKRNQELSAQIDRERTERELQTAAPASSGTVSFFLTPVLTRGSGDTRRNLIPADARQVILRLNFNDAQYENYAASITTPEGREVWRRDSLKPKLTENGKLLSVQIPATVFATNDYIVSITGNGSGNKVARYAFSAIRR